MVWVRRRRRRHDGRGQRSRDHGRHARARIPNRCGTGTYVIELAAGEARGRDQAASPDVSAGSARSPRRSAGGCSRLSGAAGNAIRDLSAASCRRSSFPGPLHGVSTGSANAHARQTHGLTSGRLTASRQRRPVTASLSPAVPTERSPGRPIDACGRSPRVPALHPSDKPGARRRASGAVAQTAASRTVHARRVIRTGARAPGSRDDRARSRERGRRQDDRRESTVSMAKIAVAPPGVAFTEALRGERIAAVGRRGKFIVVQLGSGRRLAVHLRMTGRLIVQAAGTTRNPTPTPTSCLRFTDGWRLCFADVRQFGRMRLHRGRGGLGRRRREWSPSRRPLPLRPL